LLEPRLLNQTPPTAYERRKDPTVTPTHTLKTLFRQVVPNKIVDYALQTLSGFVERPNVYDRRLVDFSPLFAKPLLRDVLSTKNYVQNAITFIRTDFPILHLEMIFPENTHLQSSKVSVKTATLRFKRACERHEPQSLFSILANSQTTHQTLISSPLLLGVNLLTFFYVTSKLKIEFLGRQLLGY
jgi:hypothetical protein